MKSQLNIPIFMFYNKATFLTFTMLPLKDIRTNPEQFKKTLARKGSDPQLIDDVLALDIKKREMLQLVENAKAAQNAASKQIPSLSGAEKEAVLADMKTISETKKKHEEALNSIDLELNTIMKRLPNPPHETAPDGKSDAENVVVRTWGEKPNFDFTPKEHWELAEQHGILDTERSAKVSGARFYYLREELAMLQRALMFWAFTEMRNKGYSPTVPPFLTRREAIEATGFFDKDENYCVNPDDEELYLIGTSEVPMVSFHADEIIDEADLPKRYVAYSPCFRREAGSYGKDTKGIFRVHQFEKIEMVVFAKPEDSEKIHQEILEIEEDLLRQLGIPYQVVNVCCGDLGVSAAKKYDLEAWLPGQNAFREMTSTSICTDFQTRRLNTRIRRADGTIEYAHALNGTAVSSRPLVAILENFQQADGSIIIPEVLRPFCGFDKIR